MLSRALPINLRRTSQDEKVFHGHEDATLLIDRRLRKWLQEKHKNLLAAKIITHLD